MFPKSDNIVFSRYCFFVYLYVSSYRSLHIQYSPQYYLNTVYNCPYCGRNFKKNGLAIHILKAHPNADDLSFPKVKTNKIQESKRMYQKKNSQTHPEGSGDYNMSKLLPTMYDCTVLAKSFDIDPLTLQEDTYLSPWYDCWVKVTNLKRLQYDLPCGSIRFVRTLAEAILIVANNQEFSERMICF